MSACGHLPSALMRDERSGLWLRFSAPGEIVCACELDEVTSALERVEQAVEREGRHAAGFLSYEASPAFDPALPAFPPDAFPLLWFGLFDAPAQLDEIPFASACAKTRGGRPHGWLPEVTEAEYRRAFARIQRGLCDGESYQVNYTHRLRTSFSFGDGKALFAGLIAAQECGCGGYLDAGAEWVVCSASPELFFRLDGDRIVSRPMKGTASRGLTCAQDRENARRLRHSGKERAENVMVVDMVRNDLGRIARPGTVDVPSLFAVEQYPTVWQMVSTVRARTDASLREIFGALFPPSSITGAPKRETMGIIREIERSPRHVYTGALGFLSPGRKAQFNVAIRTVLLNKRSGGAEYGVGGGIIHDSTSEREWEECRLKARVLGVRRPEFDLLETILWRPGRGYYLLREHIRRLAGTARYFNYPLDGSRLRQELNTFEASLRGAPHRVRLLISRRGAIKLEAFRLEADAMDFVDIALATEPVDRADTFLYHKTTNRAAYERALAAQPAFRDVLLWNKDGEITETTIANVVAEIGSELLTPPVSCGLLAGVARGHLLKTGKIRERVISRDDISAASRLFLVNSVRGLRPACLSVSQDRP